MIDQNTEENKKLYSQRAILAATFFGGPLAAGILTQRNFINLGKERYGRNALIIGIISTVVIFGGIFIVPEDILDKIPNIVIPTVYMAIVGSLIEKYLASDLKEHLKNSNPFYSIWRAIGIGAGCLVLLITVILGYALSLPDDFDTEKYDSGVAEFFENETQALRLYSIIDDSAPEVVISHIDNIGLPAWQRNLAIIDELDAIEGLYSELKRQNETLKRYSTLRIEVYQLIRQAISEDTDRYNEQIDALHIKIEEIIDL